MTFATKQEALAYVQATPARVTVEIGDATQTFYVPAKEFKSGSVGYYAGEKVTLAVGDRVQIGLNMTVIGSKALPASSPIRSP